jgi:hypothetical protein
MDTPDRSLTAEADTVSRPDQVFPTLTSKQVARIATHGKRRPTTRDEVLVEVGDRPRVEIFQDGNIDTGYLPPLDGHTDRGAEMAEEILKRLKRSRTTWERVAYLVRNHLRHMQAPDMRLSTLKRFLGEEGIDELLELTRIDALSSNGDLRHYQFCRDKQAELRETEIHPEPLVRGRDLIAMGLAPGPSFSEILRQVEEAQLSGDLRNREEAIQWIDKNFRNRGL